MKNQKDIKLILNHKILSEFTKCIEDAYPNEATGLIFGIIKEIPNNKQEKDFFYHYISKKFSCVPPDSSSNVSFLINNEELLHNIIIDETKKKKGKTFSRLIGIFHSHPIGSFPSSKDMEQMKYLDYFSSINHKFGNKAFKNLIWVIMNAKNKDIDGYIYFNKEFLQIEIIICED